MSSAGIEHAVTCKQPKLVLPRVTTDPMTNAQRSPQTQAEEVDHALLELIQSVQHELRTPLHGMFALITSLSHDMQKEIKETGNEQRVRDVQALGVQLLSILDDFRDYSHYTIEARHPEEQHEILPNEEVDLGDILDEMTTEVWNNQVRSLQAAKGPDVRIPPPPELILTLDTSLQAKTQLVCVDSFRIVARKLIDNALRFTPGEGYIEVSLSPHREEDTELKSDTSKATKSFLRLSIEDTGNGMTNDFLSEHLFTPFCQGRQVQIRCWIIDEFMFSSGWYERWEDRCRYLVMLEGVQQSLFYCLKSLPEKSYTDSPKLETPKELVYFFRFDSVGLKRLAGSIASQLATFGNLYTTTHVEEADCILLPEEVCYGSDNDALDELLLQARDGIKIGVLQAHKDAKIEMTAKENKALPPVYVTRKPFGPRSFSQLLQLATRDIESDHQYRGRIEEGDTIGTPEIEAPTMRRDSSTASVGSRKSADHHSIDLVFSTDMSDEILRGTPPAAKLMSPLWGSNSATYNPFKPKFSALCVEDNPLNMRILTRVLSQCKIPFTMAADGVEAVDLFKKTQPSIVLLDINIPRMDGYEAAKEMRKCRQREKAKIIAITALSDEYSRKKGLQECEMDDWLCKPLDINGFKKRLQQIQQEHERASQ